MSRRGPSLFRPVTARPTLSSRGDKECSRCGDWVFGRSGQVCRRCEIEKTVFSKLRCRYTNDDVTCRNQMDPVNKNEKYPFCARHLPFGENSVTGQPITFSSIFLYTYRVYHIILYLTCNLVYKLFHLCMHIKSNIYTIHSCLFVCFVVVSKANESLVHITNFTISVSGSMKHI